MLTYSQVYHCFKPVYHKAIISPFKTLFYLDNLLYLWVMGLPLQSLEVGINTTNTLDKELDTCLATISKYFCTPIELIKIYIPVVTGLRVKSCFDALVMIHSIPRETLTFISVLNGADKRSLKRCYAHLLKLGYIRVINRPRLIHPFRRYKIDKGYVITTKGKTVLSKLLNYQNRHHN